MCNFEYSSQTHTGKKRAEFPNEDAVFAFRAENGVGLFAIADGMYKGSEDQRGLVADVALSAAVAFLLPHLQENTSTEKMKELVGRSMQCANAAVLNRFRACRTTLTIGILLKDTLVVAHIGNCRVYVCDETHSLKQITRDHSVSGELVRAGLISPQQAVNHPMRKTLYHTLGGQELSQSDIDIVEYTCTKKSTIVFCSDGVWEYGDVIFETCLFPVSHQQQLETVFEQANAQGGNDNMSAILVHW